LHLDAGLERQNFVITPFPNFSPIFQPSDGLGGT
jgi:hypothetical protein